MDGKRTFMKQDLVFLKGHNFKENNNNNNNNLYLRMFAGYNFDFSTSGFYLVE